MFENYLLHSEAIAVILNRPPTFQKQPIGKATIEEWISTNGADKGYLSGSKAHAPQSPGWLKELNGARLLFDLFADLSNQQESYQKVTYGIALTEWILQNDRNFIDELIQYVVALIPKELRQ